MFQTREGISGSTQKLIKGLLRCSAVYEMQACYLLQPKLKNRAMKTPEAFSLTDPVQARLTAKLL